MPNVILSNTRASVSELKKNPMATVSAGASFPVAILNRNPPAFYCVSAALYARLLASLDDRELAGRVKVRAKKTLIEVDLDS